jgi:hypothetical protein
VQQKCPSANHAPAKQVPLKVQKTQPTTQQNQAPAKDSETLAKRQLTTLRDTHNSKDSHPTEFLAKIKFP